MGRLLVLSVLVIYGCASSPDQKRNMACAEDILVFTMMGLGGGPSSQKLLCDQNPEHSTKTEK